MSLAMAWSQLGGAGRAHFDDYLASRRAGLLPPERLAEPGRERSDHNGGRVIEISSWDELRKLGRPRRRPSPDA